MKSKKLRDMATVSISGVDKKCFSNETEVSLCNFTDIYYNWQLDEGDVPSFMRATAKEDEIEDFTLQKGDVCITKDSETRDDIGVSCLICDDLKLTILGYHCALIRPNRSLLDGQYLNCFLSSATARRYFSFRASGSGQRYTLSLENIEDIEIPYIELQSQKEIGSLIYSINRKIKLNKKINDNLLQISLSYFKHRFLQKTPNEKLKEILIEHAKSQIQVNEAKKCFGNIPFFTSGDEILFSNTEISKSSSCFLNTGGNADVKFFASSAGYSTDTWCISAKRNLTEYLFLYLLTYKEELQKKYFQGTGLKHLQKDQLRNKEIYIPSEGEIAAMNELLIPNLKAYSSNFIQNHRLKKLRDYLLPLLLNGQVTIR